MPNVDDMILFAEVLKAGGFSRAANLLGLPKSSISRRITALETALGVRLLERSTRRMRLTEIGESFLAHCQRIADEVTLATQVVESVSHSPKGLLRVSASYSVGRELLGPVTAQFLQQFPEAKVQLLLTNRRINLIEEGFDLAIRVGPLADSNLIAKKIGSSRLLFCTSLAYLKTIKPPKTPADLTSLCVLHMDECFTSFTMTLQGTQSTETITLPFRGVINDFHLLKQMLIDGAGIALLPNFLCINELATGTLVNLLPEWSLPEVDFHAIYPSQRGVTPKLRAFLALLETHLINVGHPRVHAAH